jgi:uncharacterized protein YydD (DUF2326 family)
MISRIFSSLKTFKELRFRPGLNLLFADKTAESSSKHTRNSAGKSSVLETIHFLTAGDCPEDSIFRDPALVNYRFGMEFELGRQAVTVERSGAKPNEIVVVDGDTSAWPVQPESSPSSGDKILSVKDWARVLGLVMFGLDEQRTKNPLPYAPTFRSLFPYFVRRLPGGFTEPHLHFIQAKPASWQVAVSFLLGLDWTIPQEWQIVRDEEDEIKKLKSAVGEGDLAEVVGKKAQIRAEIATVERTVRSFRERLDSFQVLPDFRDYERRASQLTQEIADLADANTLDRELVSELERAIAEEKPPQTMDLERAYKEVGITLPGVALKRFDEVRRFHESVIANRKLYLGGELESAKRRIELRENQKVPLQNERQRIMGILRSHGALEQFSNLQADYGHRTADLELLKKRFVAAEKIEEGLARLKIRRQQLLLRLKQDYTEQAAALDRAIVAFEEISNQLYRKPAKFTPTETTNGPEFRVIVEGERSPGIRNMQILCFDLMLIQLVTERAMGPRFLVHDSHIFDPVDARQVGTALMLGATLSEAKGFQYIVTLNSDKQIEIPAGFELSRFELPVKLTDATETGGLFGVRFG